MQETKEENFHNFALKSSLFKGQLNLYFCYVKSEKLAFALQRIIQHVDIEKNIVLENILTEASALPKLMLQFAARLISLEQVLVSVFSTLSLLRLGTSNSLINEENTALIIHEYELLAYKIGYTPKYLTLQDLATPEMPAVPELPARAFGGQLLTDKGKGLIRDMKDFNSKGRNNNRAGAILKIINENKRVSIKDISKVVRDCSEKTIQRELAALISEGVVRKEGKKRWSMYLPA